MKNKKEEVRFSMKALTEIKRGKSSSNMRSNKATKRAQSKGKYDIKIVDGIKYMRLRDY